MLIAIDIDDVLLDMVPSLAGFHNERYGTGLIKEDFHSYKFSEVWGGSDEEAGRRVEEFLGGIHFVELSPVKGAVEGVKRLARDNRLISITSRHKKLKGLTERVLRKYFPQIEAVHFSHNAYVDFRNDKTKSQYCIELGVRTIIEDSLEYAEDCRSNGIDAVLLDQPWNRGREIDSVRRVYSWQQVTEHFKC
ncbi:MAG: hypothetical protein KKB79_03210 [Nanoarchaeota archaeon]|nr:hypothetical protein [Nanoarchaeota archaeon]